MQVRKIAIEKVSEEFNNFSGALLVGLGFDSRCLTFLSHFPIEKGIEVVGVSNAGWANQNESNIKAFQSAVGKNDFVLGQGAGNIIEVADQLAKKLKIVFSHPTNKLLVDITSFSHELLVLLIGMLSELNVLSRTKLAYVGASAYSTNTDKKSMWLSRGVKNVRSILGFPGLMLPSKKLHLIILAGFEVERASEVIKRYEPAYLSIGLGAKNQSISEDHHNRNKEFFVDIFKFAEFKDFGTDSVFNFQFSCVSPYETKDQLLEHIRALGGLEEKNFVVCPLNTKLSTVGVALAAIEHPEIQTCYAEPEEYNAEGYASPGNQVALVTL